MSTILSTVNRRLVIKQKQTGTQNTKANYIYKLQANYINYTNTSHSHSTSLHNLLWSFLITP